MAISLNQLVRSAHPKPPIMTLYGVHGIGKSTFASQAPSPVFIQTEDGLGMLDCAHFPLATSSFITGSRRAFAKNPKIPHHGAAQNSVRVEQRRLARAVAADQADAFIGFKGKAGVVQQSDMPESQLGIE